MMSVRPRRTCRYVAGRTGHSRSRTTHGPCRMWQADARPWPLLRTARPSGPQVGRSELFLTCGGSYGAASGRSIGTIGQPAALSFTVSSCHAGIAPPPRSIDPWEDAAAEPEGPTAAHVPVPNGLVSAYEGGRWAKRPGWPCDPDTPTRIARPGRVIPACRYTARNLQAHESRDQTTACPERTACSAACPPADCPPANCPLGSVMRHFPPAGSANRGVSPG